MHYRVKFSEWWGFLVAMGKQRFCFFYFHLLMKLVRLEDRGCIAGRWPNRCAPSDALPSQLFSLGQRKSSCAFVLSVSVLCYPWHSLHTSVTTPWNPLNRHEGDAFFRHSLLPSLLPLRTWASALIILSQLGHKVFWAYFRLVLFSHFFPNLDSFVVCLFCTA